MNFLELCKRVHQELGAGDGSLPGTVPTTVTSQTGDLLRIVGWVQRAWEEIQATHEDWLFLQREGTLPTVIDQQAYTITVTSETALTASSVTRAGSTATMTFAAAHGYVSGQTITVAGANETDYNGTFTVLSVPTALTLTYAVSNAPATPATGTVTAVLVDFDRVRPWRAAARAGYIKSYTTATGVTDEQPIYYLVEQEFEGFYDRGNVTSTGRPVYYTIKRDGRLALFPKPGAVYTVTLPYQRRPQLLARDTDIPLLPLKHHMAIIYKAMTYYGQSGENSRQYETASDNYEREYRRMCNEQLPHIPFLGNAS